VVLVSLYSEPSSLALSPCLLFISSSIQALCYYPFGCVPKVPREGTSKITGFTIISHIQNAILEKMDRKCGEKSRLNLATVMKMMNNHQICGYTWIHYFQTNPDYTFGQDGTSPALKNPLWLDLEFGNLHLRVSFLLPEMGSGWWLWDVDGCCGGPISNTLW
jgi:hypothetical protein